ncbi:MAG TPA: glycosyltransferase [Longimicrobiales bacterium]|nr:glycosyltransferase [Longimicrobiales bacterium]
MMILEALANAGQVDLAYVGEVGGWAEWVPPTAPVRSVREIAVRRIRPNLIARLGWMVWPARPLQLVEWERPPRLSTYGDYDVIWYFRPVTLQLAGGIPARRVIVDLDDLEDAKLAQAGDLRGRRRSWNGRVAEKLNAGAWRRCQERIARQVDAVTVANVADRTAFGAGNCYLVPNGFPDVPFATAPGASLRILLVGQFEYDPNADAAEYFVREIFPGIRTSRPDAIVRLVGRAPPRVRRLAGNGVEVVGEVDDLAAEYAGASVAVSPVRYGSGTRVKILEAFARGVPVVSTPVGAAGIDAVHGREILLAEDPASFASACVALMSDPEARRVLSAGARSLYEQRYGQEAVTSAVHRVLRAVGLLSTPAPS